jgi:transposase
MSKKEPLPKDWREGRRLRAWQLYQQGWKQKDIAAALGVSEGAVSQWITKAKKQGSHALRHQPSPGRPPKLSREQRAQLPTLLDQGAEAFGFRGQVWTTKRVAQMMKKVLGVSYHPGHCSRLLAALKYSLQKPKKRATQRDEAAIRNWKEQRWDELKKSERGKTHHCLRRRSRLLSVAYAGTHLCPTWTDAYLVCETDP